MHLPLLFPLIVNNYPLSLLIIIHDCFAIFFIVSIKVGGTWVLFYVTDN